MCTYMYIYIHYTYMYVYMYTYMQQCMHTLIYTHIYTHTHIYIYHPQKIYPQNMQASHYKRELFNIWSYYKSEGISCKIAGSLLQTLLGTLKLPSCSK